MFALLYSYVIRHFQLIHNAHFGNRLRRHSHQLQRVRLCCTHKDAADVANRTLPPVPSPFPAPCATINAILEAGPLAPTAKNLQGQRIYVVQSAEGLAKIDALTPCRYGAPTVLVVAYDKNSVFVFPGGKANSGEEDASIVATHMMLAETVKYL